MNVLVLTPDAVGSTLLQRLITIYMTFYDFGKPVINLHELTNGLISYYNPEFNREPVGKPPFSERGYYQTLPEIVDLLSTVDHFKTSRLSQYHIRNRNDSIADQVSFYKYLNDNFYIIACKRDNILEYALGWVINSITKKLNVYTASDKLDSFIDLYRSKVEVDQEVLVSLLDQYKEYLEWTDRYFSVGSYFNYERDVPNIENFVLNLPIFSSQSKKITWEETYGIDFQNWNKCHYLMSDIGGILLENQSKESLKIDYKQNRKGNNVPLVQNEIISHLPQVQKDFVEKNKKAYSDAWHSHRKMVDLGIMVTGVPIKKQTFKEKKLMIRNFEQCVDTYNAWALKNPNIASPLDDSSIQESMNKERTQWTNVSGSQQLHNDIANTIKLISE